MTLTEKMRALQARMTKGPWHRESAIGATPDGGFVISDDLAGFVLCIRAPWTSRVGMSVANGDLFALADELPALVIALAASHELLCRRATDPIENHHQLAEEVAAILQRIEGRMKP